MSSLWQAARHAQGLLSQSAVFGRRLLRRFMQHHGLLLAAAVAFDALVSIVPLLALALIVASYMVDPEDVKNAIASGLHALMPGAIEPITQAYATSLEQRGRVGGLMIASLFVFGAFAFRTLREALTVIFDTPRTQRRRGIASRLAPLSYVALVGAGILVSSLLLTVLDTLPPQGLDLFGLQWGFRPTLRSLIRLLSLVVLVLLFASFYRFLAPERQSFRLSVVGGLFAVSIWEVARLLVLFYFTHLSTVGVVYGSLASIIVLLVSLDIAALAVLLGGQLIAEVARSHRAQLPWHTEPPSMSEAASGADEKEV